MKKGNLKASLDKKLPDCSLPMSQQQLIRKMAMYPLPCFLKVKMTMETTCLHNTFRIMPKFPSETTLNFLPP